MTLLTGRKTAWSDSRNRMLAVALTILESESCKGCGTPLWVGHSTNNAVQFKVKRSTCYGCAELDKHREQAQQSKRKDYGAVHYVAPYNVWGPEEPLPGREEYYERVAAAEAREAAAEAAEDDGPPPLPLIPR